MDGTTENPSRETKLSGANGDRENIDFYVVHRRPSGLLLVGNLAHLLLY